jgi:hypothetical protein
MLSPAKKDSQDQYFEAGVKQNTNEKISHQSSLPNDPNQPRSTKRSQILINPQNYTIRKNDIAYAICDNHAVAMNTRLINSVDSDLYKTFLKNYDFIRKNVSSRRIR